MSNAYFSCSVREDRAVFFDNQTKLQYMKSTLLWLWFIATIALAAADSESAAAFIASKVVAGISLVILYFVMSKRRENAID